MGIITRYLWLELIKVFLVALAALTGFVIVFVIVQRALDLGLGPVEIIRMIPYALPQALQLTLPGTLLFTACMVYGRMSGTNEIMALKAMGVSPKVVLRPVLILSLALSIVAVWLNDVSLSWGEAGIRRVGLEAVESVVYNMLRTLKSYKTEQGFEVTVKRVDDERRRLVMPVIRYRSKDGSSFSISADEAQLRTDPVKGELVVTLWNAQVDDGGRAVFSDSEVFEWPIPLEAACRSKRLSDLSPSKLPLQAIAERTEDQKVLIERAKEAMAADAAYQMLTGDFNTLAGSYWESKRAYLADSIVMLHKLEAEPWRRWANGFSCLCFVLVGAPMAIRLRNSDVLTTFFLCFMPILIVYYPLLTFGASSAKGGDLPPIAVWIANALLVCWGVWLLRRVFRY
jgi:lipopolysaccharide export system permease protein